MSEIKIITGGIPMDAMYKALFDVYGKKKKTKAVKAEEIPDIPKPKRIKKRSEVTVKGKPNG